VQATGGEATEAKRQGGEATRQIPTDSCGSAGPHREGAVDAMPKRSDDQAALAAAGSTMASSDRNVGEKGRNLISSCLMSPDCGRSPRSAMSAGAECPRPCDLDGAAYAAPMGAA